MQTPWVDMRRIPAFTAAVIFLAGQGYSQQPPPDDAHENPVIQNAPAGKKEPPDTPSKSTPRPKETKPLKATSNPEPPTPRARPAPALNTEEAILGTWQLAPEMSKFNPGPAPKAQVRIYERTADGIQVTIRSTAADGAQRSITYPWQVDGKEHLMQGSKLLDSMILSKTDNLTSEATMKHGDMVIATERREISADGHTMTIEAKDVSSADQPISSTAFYQKQ